VSSQEVFTFLLDPLVVVYGEPKTADVGAFLREYAGIMSDFTAEELMHAKATIMRKHEFKSFPTPAECLKACAEARKELSPVGGDRRRARIEGTGSVEMLDRLWSSEIAPRRNAVSKGTFDGVRFAANKRAVELAAKEHADRITGEASGG
jgi:hypothetical protein